MSTQVMTRKTEMQSLLPDWPLAIWMVAITLAIGLSAGMSADTLVRSYNAGFGAALGEFALILLPSFMLAAAMDRRASAPPAGVAVAASPLAGAGMVCPDTAYAALAPVAGARRLDVAFGSYAGFKLLYPAGPLIVATGLGVPDDTLVPFGLALLIPVWGAGVLWARLLQPADRSAPRGAWSASGLMAALFAFSPFLVLAGLLIAGAVFDFSWSSALDFLTQPKGALLSAAVLALAGLAGEARRACLDSAVRRTGSLLLVIGVASAFGAVLTTVVPLGAIVPTGAGLWGVIGLFTLTALFKLAQGSSMATFAAVAPVAAPIVAGMELAPAAAVFAICVGSFVAILPNDSYYWLVRRDTLQDHDDPSAMAILAGGAIVQACTGLALILLAVWLGVI